MSALTHRERQLLDFLDSYIQQNGFSPSVRLIREAMGYRSNSPVQVYLNRLEQKGAIYREKGKARTVRLMHSAEHSEGVFLKGTIAAGGVVESFPDHSAEPIQLPEPFNKPGNYALRVMGDSMIESHICSGDFVILRPVSDVQTLKPGSIVAARVEGEGTTLKHFYLKEGRAFLKPANFNFKTYEEDASRVQVQGVLVGIWREY
ncbi:MAG: transcriptional repressor LexA [Leptolyngbyaceae cyanobacterium bins.349]|nr:transcriptional repressor LexA [Leptolyngbyaceae cyanobacterium bins.349]